ncbi:MAG: SET domain-containing protein [Egibacteraceae bacterium]
MPIAMAKPLRVGKRGLLVIYLIDEQLKLIILEGRPYGRGLAATRSLTPNEVIADLSGCVVTDEPTVYSIALGDRRYIDEPPVSYLNHSCMPNVFGDTGQMRMKAIRPITAGEELTFFYPSTEWEMVGPFKCMCGAPACLVWIAGAIDVPEEVLSRYELNDHIKQRLRQDR